jgi:hypothetical protein
MYEGVRYTNKNGTKTKHGKVTLVSPTTKIYIIEKSGF